MKHVKKGKRKKQQYLLMHRALQGATHAYGIKISKCACVWKEERGSHEYKKDNKYEVYVI
jgi:hypothetical protein